MERGDYTVVLTITNDVLYCQRFTLYPYRLKVKKGNMGESRFGNNKKRGKERHNSADVKQR